MINYSFVDLIDTEKLQRTFEHFSSATGLPAAILDPEENILVASGWVDICTKYHRCHLGTEARCRESDAFIKSHLHKQESVAYKCKNGLWDVAMPIILQGKHVATLFCGQFFYEDDPPDIEVFRKQAMEHGFNESDYLSALNKVPVFSRKQILQYMKYLTSVSAMLSEIELSNLRMKEEIRERRNAELELLKAHALMQHLINSIPDLIFYKDKDSIYLGGNDAFLEYAGTTREYMIGYTDFDFFPTDVAEFFREKDRQMFEEGKPRRNEEWVEYPDGRKVLLDTLKTPYYGPNNELLGLIGVSRDITESKRYEEERAKTAKLESIGVLAGGIAHDFNNLLMSIIGNVALAKMAIRDDPATVDILKSAEEASMRARDLAKQLLTFSRGGMPVKEVFNLGGLLKETSSFSLRGSNVKCKLNIQDDLFMIDADKGQISQVINNLIINAVQAMPDGGRIDLTAENITGGCSGDGANRQENYVKITFADQGCGIDEKILNNIFDPYFTTKQQGSGLGLTTSYSIIKKHGGEIEVESTPGKGTVFRIVLPASDQHSIVTDKREKARNVKTGKFLVMDDEPAIRSITKQMLEIQGHQVQTAEDGRQAIEIFTAALQAEEPFDCVIVDLTVPGGMGGKQTAAVLLELDPTVKIIVSSGYSEDPVIADYKKYGFCGSLAKPYSIDQFEEVLGNLFA